MKTGIKTAATVAAIIAAAMTADAQDCRQGKRSGQGRYCPECGSLLRNRQKGQYRQKGQKWQNAPRKQYRRGGQGRQQFGPRDPQYGHPQFAPHQRREGPPRFQGPRTDPRHERQSAPQNRREFRRRMFERFDHDGNGRLSEEERKAAKDAVKKHRRKGRKEKPDQPPIEED